MHAFRTGVLAGLLTIGLSSSPALATDIYGTGVDDGNAEIGIIGGCGYPFEGFPFCVRPGHDINGFGEVVPGLPGVKDPLDLGIQEAPYFYELARDVSGTRYAYVVPAGTAALIPDQVRDLIPAIDQTSAVDEVDTVFYSAHSALLAASRAGYSDCDARAFCLWQHSHYRGRMLQFFDSGYWQRLSNYGFNDEASSARNRRSRDTLVSDDLDGNGNPGGRIPCFDSYSAAAHFGGFNDDASGVFNSASDGRC